MALIPIDNVGQHGVIKDINSWQVPNNAWTDGNNVRSEHGAIQKTPGYKEVMASCPVAPYHVVNLVSGSSSYWIIGGLTKIYVHNGSVWTNITRQTSGSDVNYNATTREGWTSTVLGGVLIMTNGEDDPQYWGLTNGVPAVANKMADLSNWPSYTLLAGAMSSSSSTSSIAVDSTDTFPSAGTFTIDSEKITYTGKTDTSFTGITRGVDSTSGATHSDNAAVFVNVECNSMRAFRSFLVGLNITRAGVNYGTLVKWSTEAATQTLPTSWDESDATVDAGEYALEDTKGVILDGLPLGDSFMIYKEDSTYMMTYVGTPFIFAFRQISPNVGALSKNCVAEFDGGHFIFGNGDLYLNDGQRLTSLLPHKMRDHVFSNMNGDEHAKSFVAADYAAGEMWACYVSSGNTTNVQCDKALIWNWVNNTLTERDIPNLGFVGYGVESDPLSSASWAADTSTWEDNTLTWSTVGSASFVNTTGRSLVLVSPTDTKLYRHDTGNKNDTANMTSYIERTGLTIDESGRNNPAAVKHVTAVWPKMTVTEDTTVNVYVGSQMSTEEDIKWEGPYTFDSFTQSKVPVRVSGKYIGIKFESTGDQTWRLDGYDLELKNSGIRGSKMN